MILAFFKKIYSLANITDIDFDNIRRAGLVLGVFWSQIDSLRWSTCKILCVVGIFSGLYFFSLELVLLCYCIKFDGLLPCLH